MSISANLMKGDGRRSTATDKVDAALYTFVHSTGIVEGIRMMREGLDRDPERLVASVVATEELVLKRLGIEESDVGVRTEILRILEAGMERGVEIARDL